MLNSLNILKNFPLETKVYCGHEYTLQNSKFCIKYDSNNKQLKEKIIEIKTITNFLLTIKFLYIKFIKEFLN